MKEHFPHAGNASQHSQPYENRTWSHLNVAGQVHMVDVSHKQPTKRVASAQATVQCSDTIMAALLDGTTPKGDVFALVRIAGINAVKLAPQLLPLAHVIGIHGASVDIAIEGNDVTISATVTAFEITGVEMEALTCVTVAALAFVDMVKGIDKQVSITNCFVTKKEGGKSGFWQRSDQPC